jgi:hypothetical protein
MQDSAKKAAEALLGAPLAAGFGRLARARGDRALHPKGEVLAARTSFCRAVPGLPALTEGRTFASTLRLSRALGFPRAVPDILGFALRLHDLHGPGRPQDLLLASSPRPPLHVTLAPARDRERCWYTGLLRYRIGHERSILVVHGLGAGRFVLGTAAPLHADISPLAEVVVTERLEPAPDEAAAFDPIVHSTDAFRQDAGILDGVRARSYRASRAHRP